MGEGHFRTHGKRGQFVRCENPPPISGVGFNPLTPASEVVIYTSTPRTAAHSCYPFHEVALEFIFSWPRRKTGFASLRTAKRREVPLSDLMAVLSAPRRLWSKPPAGSFPAGARLLLQGRKPQTLTFASPRNDCADVVQTSPCNVSVLLRKRL